MKILNILFSVTIRLTSPQCITILLRIYQNHPQELLANEAASKSTETAEVTFQAEETT